MSWSKIGLLHEAPHDVVVALSTVLSRLYFVMGWSMSNPGVVGLSGLPRRCRQVVVGCRIISSNVMSNVVVVVVRASCAVVVRLVSVSVHGRALPWWYVAYGVATP